MAHARRDARERPRNRAAPFRPRGACLGFAAAVIALAAAAAPASANHAGPLAGQWHLDEIDAGGDATPDSSGHGLDATTSPQANLLPGRFGNAYQPDNFSRIRVLDNPVLETPAVTAIAWIRRSGSPGNAKYVIGKGDIAGCNGSSYALYSGADGTGNLRFQVYDGAANRQSPAAGPLLWDGAWHMVAGTYDGSRVRLYVDGAEVGAGTPAPGAVAYGTNDDTLSIGSYPNDDCGDTFFRDAIDEPRIYGRALSATEIARLAAHPGPDPPVLVPDSSQPPPTGGQPQPPPPPPGGGGGASTPAQAAFTASATRVAAGQLVRFDASSSYTPGSDVRQLAWDLTGDARPEVTCDPETPVLQTSFLRPGTVTARLAVTDSTGAVTSAAQTLTVSRAQGTRVTLPRRVAARIDLREFRRDIARADRLLTRARPTALCAPSPSRPVSGVDTTGLGGPAAGCVAQMEVYTRLLAAVGCLRETSVDDLPQAERVVVRRTLGRVLRLDASEFRALDAVTAAGRAGASQFGRLSPGVVEQARRVRSAVETRIYVADGPVRINGLDYAPRGNGVVVITAPGLADRLGRPHVISSNVAITAPTDALGVVPLRSGQLRLPVDVDRKRIASFDLQRVVPFLPATGLQGRADVRLRQDESDFITQLRLPRSFTKAGGGDVTAKLELRASNRNGIRLEGFEVSGIEAELFGVGVDIDFLRWSRGVFRGRASLGFGIGTIGAELAMRGSAIEFLNIIYEQGPPGIKIAPALFLTGVRGGFEETAQVTRFFGGVSLAAGAGLGNGCALVGIDGDLDFRVRPAPVTFTATGESQLVCIPVGRESFTVAADGYANFTAGVNYPLGPLSLTANFTATYYDGRFTAEAAARGCVGTYGCVGGRALVSDRGLAFCGDFEFFSAGAGLNWPAVPHLAAVIANVRIMVPSCDVGRWRTIAPRAAAAQSQPATIEIPSGQRVAIIGIVGADSAPAVTLRGPGGRTLTVPAGGAVRTAREVAFQVPEERTTFVALRAPAAGRWTIEPLGGARIAELRRAEMRPEPSVRATVTGRGNSRLIRYAIAPQRGQVVRLFEQAPGGARQLGVFRGRGTRRFTPSDARGVRRSLVALVEQDGQPRDRIVLDRFTAGPARIGRARRVRLRRTRRGALRITWARAAGAQGHLVSIELGDGRERQFRPRRRRLDVPNVARGTRAVVRVVGTRAGGSRRGPAATVRRRVR